MTDRRVGRHLGIVELGRLCARMRARNLELFEQVGGWVASTPDGELQRLFAAASHRHAWHGELWAQRNPIIHPVDPVEAADHRARPLATAAPTDRAGLYREVVNDMIDELVIVGDRFDATLDPSTTRTIDLVRNDLEATLAEISVITSAR